MAPTPRIENEDAQDVLDKIWKLQPPDVLKAEKGMRYGHQTKYLSWTVPDTKAYRDGITLIHITDLQFGHVACKLERVIEYRDWILAEPNRFCLFGGDMADLWASHSPGSPFEQLGDPQSQVYKLVEILSPLRHRVLGYVGGNHERRGIPSFGDTGHLISMLLRIPYSAGQQFIDVHYGAHTPFKIQMWHGVGGARTKGTVAQNLHRFMTSGDSHLYLVGHYHQPMVIPMWKVARDGLKRRAKITKCIGAVSSSFLESWNTYAEVSGFAATDVLMAATQLERNGKWQVNLRTVGWLAAGIGTWFSTQGTWLASLMERVV